jgi:hypothetical protein
VAIQLHVAPHPDALVSLLWDQLALPSEDPFGPDQALALHIPTPCERWGGVQRIAR